MADTEIEMFDYEKRAETAARAAGWYVNDDGNFEIIIGCDVPDVLTNISPSDIGAWGMLCDMESIDVSSA